MVVLRTVKPGEGMTYPDFISQSGEADLSASLPLPVRPGRCTGHFFDPVNNRFVHVDMGPVYCRPVLKYPTAPKGQKEVAVLVPLQLIPDSGTLR